MAHHFEGRPREPGCPGNFDEIKPGQRMKFKDRLRILKLKIEFVGKKERYTIFYCSDCGQLNKFPRMDISRS